MPTCRVYLFTYKRPELLPRAIKSLLGQTFTDWICEVHNDCPNDNNPEEYIKTLNDTRFIIKNHPNNLGPTKSFNLAFNGCTEEYSTLLEDDNWWEPDFLNEAILVLESRPSIPICWSNMVIWKELPGNKWENTKKNIWDINSDQIFEWPHIKQVLGAVHSNGAMLWRSKNSPKYKIPDNSIFNAVELIRERTFDYPLYLIAKPLANYAFTLQTHQSQKDWEWTGTQVMLYESFVNNLEEQTLIKEIEQFYKDSNGSFLVFSLTENYSEQYSILKLWTKFKWFAASPLRFLKFRQFLRDQKNVSEFLAERTKFQDKVTFREPLKIKRE
jgi:glycosyltransferase involved in cell wall biosynthesis